MKSVQHFKSIKDFHRFGNLPDPEHPLISVIDYSRFYYSDTTSEIRWIQDFYSIGLKRDVGKKFNYGQSVYDFDAGIFVFVAPKQRLHVEVKQTAKAAPSGYLLLIHPDFLWNTPLAKTIKTHDFFNYAINEALFLSKKEETVIADIMGKIQGEYQTNLDKFSQDIIISQIELLLNYANRYYERQFITRKITNHQVLNRLGDYVDERFTDGCLEVHGVPSVHQVAEVMNLSPNYLSTMLKVLTGQSTQQYIQDKLIEKAKERLSTTALSVNEIAFGLGFEHATSFSKLFKSKTNSSPTAFRKFFN